MSFLEHTRGLIRRMAALLPASFGSAHAERVLFGALRALTRGDELARDRGEELRLIREAQRLDATRPGSVFGIGPDEDGRWTAAYLDRLPAERDRDARALFWQIQRVRSRLYGWITQPPGTAGLSWFSEHFERIDHLDLKSNLAAAWERSRVGGRIDAFEVRRTPGGSSLRKVWQLARELAELRYNAIPPHSRRRSAIVLHYVKSGAEEDPHANVLRCRFGDWFAERRMEAAEIEYQVRRTPELLLFLRGLDIANRELAVPTWAVLPLFEYPRVASRTVAGSENALRLTVHAGEEFRSLHEGLRRIHELLGRGGLVERDRIGHALALATDPKEWRRGAEGRRQPREERLWDLVWEHDLLGRPDPWGPRTTRRLRRIEAEVERLVNQLRWNQWLRPDRNLTAQLIELRRSLLDGTALARLRYPKLEMRPTDERLALVWCFLKSRPSTASELVDTSDDELAFVTEAQQRLQHVVRQRKITVEVNPSSNLLIGALNGGDRHPAIALDKARIRISVNTDDPLTFATTLADEYELFRAALRRRFRESASEPRTTARLAMIAEQGFASTFALAASDDEARVERFLARFGESPRGLRGAT